jgi:hypothetical protein
LTSASFDSAFAASAIGPGDADGGGDGDDAGDDGVAGGDVAAPVAAAPLARKTMGMSMWAMRDGMFRRLPC